MKAPLIIFSAWCRLVLLTCSLLPSTFFDDWLTRSSKSKLLIAERVRVGLVRGMLILRLFPWQLKDLLESDLSILGPFSWLILIDCPSSPGNSNDGISGSPESSEAFSIRCSSKALPLTESSSASTRKYNEKLSGLLCGSMGVISW